LTVPIDILKIDRTFVERLVPDDGAVVVVEGLLGIASKLGLRVVAEGIETDAQLDQLLSFGCKLGQGYLFSKAVDRDVATSLLARYGPTCGPATSCAEGLPGWRRPEHFRRPDSIRRWKEVLHGTTDEVSSL
jgi:EAL domain-containing protein (putative c-di-GMP-specific phosphodiesterase class I)